MTITRLQSIALAEGQPMMIAETIGQMYGIAHIYKVLGLVEVHKQMRADLKRVMEKKG